MPNQLHSLFDRAEVRTFSGIVLWSVALVSATLIGIFFYHRATEVSRNQEPVQSELEKMVARVGAHVLVPVGEAPTIAVVTDLNLLESQSFFQEAGTGDYVLIYPLAKRAILYNPQRDRVIAMAPLADTEKPDAASSTPGANASTASP